MKQLSAWLQPFQSQASAQPRTRRVLSLSVRRSWRRHWLLWSMILSILAPGLSHAASIATVGHNVNPRVVAICTTSGLRYILGPDQEPRSANHASHECLLCSQGVDTTTPTQTTPSAEINVKASPTLSASDNVLFASTRWITPDSRAPPAAFVAFL
ncbi:MAG: DUF2946 family protein [Orrella sp.]